MHPKTAARQGALRALLAVERDEAVLTAALSRCLTSEATRGFAHEIAAGVLRHRARLDYTLAPLLKKPLGKLDAPVRAALRLAAYERLCLSTPAAVVGNEYSSLMRGERLTSAVAFVSAVARRLPNEWRAAPDAIAQPIAHLAVEYSHPEWMVERWLQRWGFAECAALCESNNRIAPLTLRVNTLRAQPQQIVERLQSRGVDAAPGKLSPLAVIVQNAGDPSQWPEWKDGLIIAQDEAAQLVSLLAAPQPGQTVIDAAAAPGGKTTHLAQLMNDSGSIVACDVAAGRLKLVRENVERLGIKSIQWQEGDLRSLAAELPAADLVLLDAPCLGTGTLRRRPDAKWRKTAQQLNELVQLQKELLDAASTLVRPGGALVYSTCSVEVEENEEQARSWLQHHPNWLVEPPGQYSPGTDDTSGVVTEDGFLQTLPHRHGCDGMFAVKLRRATE